MKKRTRIVAWICSIYYAWALVGAVGMVSPFVSKGPLHISKLGMIMGLALCIILLPAWIGMLYSKPSSWKILIFAYLLLLVFRMSEIPRIPGYWLARGEPIMTIILRCLMTFAWSILLAALPLWILLTDRPGGWNLSSAETGTEH